ncbi:MAG: acyltransferase [Clostridia bacterium]|nr:acyltransferase [Clostridia bacterium]
MIKRNCYLDVAKFLFSIIIIMHHFNIFFFGGYIVVEAFFMISGYFMMLKIAGLNDELPIGEQTVKFVLRKYKSLVWFFIPSAIIGYIVYIFALPRGTEYVLLESAMLIFEIVPLQVAGYSAFYSTGVSWYLGALFLGSMIVFPLAKKFKTNFTIWIAPLVAILIYGYISFNFNGNMNQPSVWINNIFNSGLLRGVAGLCAGCFLYECTERLKQKRISVGAKIMFTLLEISGWAYCVFIMNQHPEGIFDSIVIFVMFGLLIIGINRLSYLSYLIQFEQTKYLATISTVIYMNHYYWARFIEKQFGELPLSKQHFLYFILIIASSLLVYLIGSGIMKLINKKSRAEI